MKRTHLEIREVYTYDSYSEFVKHYNEMTKNGFRPNSPSSMPIYYTNLEMDSYLGEYYKELS